MEGRWLMIALSMPIAFRAALNSEEKDQPLIMYAQDESVSAHIRAAFRSHFFYHKPYAFSEGDHLGHNLCDRIVMHFKKGIDGSGTITIRSNTRETPAADSLHAHKRLDERP